MGAKKKVAEQQSLSPEQEQQFKYYWYAARQAITEERYDEAYVLLTFCETINPKDGATLCFLGIIEGGLDHSIKSLILLHDAFEADPYDQWYHYVKELKEIGTPGTNMMALEALEKAHDVQQKSGNVDDDLLDALQEMYLQAGYWQKALGVQDEIDLQKGYDAYSAQLRCRVYLLMHKPKKALSEVDKYLELEPSDVQFLKYRVELMYELKSKDKDIWAQYERILQLVPYDLMVLNNYAYHLATHKGDLKKAEKMSAITIQEDPYNPMYLDTYGWILHLQGQDELAYFYLMKAKRYETDETSEDIHQHLEKINSKKANYEK